MRLNVGQEIMLDEVCKRRDGCPVPNANLAIRQLRLPRRFDLFGRPLIACLRRFANRFAVPGEFEPIRSAASIYAHLSINLPLAGRQQLPGSASTERQTTLQALA